MGRRGRGRERLSSGCAREFQNLDAPQGFQLEHPCLQLLDAG